MSFTLTKALLGKDLKKMKAAFEDAKLPDVVDKIKKEMDLLNNTTLHIAITGVTGAGKSSLVNALRGLPDHGEGAAETDVVECTMEPRAYPHPQFPQVTFWDLPGIGTNNFKADKYLKQVDFKKYDFFIIVSKDRFMECDFKLACAIKKIKKKFYYVRTRIDSDIFSEKKKPNFDEEKTLQKIRNNCMENLKQAGEDSAMVFLISRWDLSMYDFPLLENTLEEDLDGLKREVLIMACPAFSGEIIERKKKIMSGLIWMMSFLSCAAGAAPVPGLSLACDTVILVSAMIAMYHTFGLDGNSLRGLGERVGIPVDELRSAKKSTSPKEITPEFALNLLRKSALWVTTSLIEFVLDFVPGVGSVFGGVSSFITTYYMLNCFLKDVVEDAHNILAKVQEKRKLTK